MLHTKGICYHVGLPPGLRIRKKRRQEEGGAGQQTRSECRLRIRRRGGNEEGVKASRKEKSAD